MKTANKPAPPTYYVFRNDREEGPFSAAQLRSLWLGGTVTGDMNYRLDGDSTWYQLSGLSERIENPLASQPGEPVPSVAQFCQLLAWLCLIVGLVMLVLAIGDMGNPRATGEVMGLSIGVILSAAIWFVAARAIILLAKIERNTRVF